MCGIIGYTGRRPCYPILIQGLRRLEYRGYDSAGLAILENGRIRIARAAGKIERLAEDLDRDPPGGTCGIAHTRWATHGEPSRANAHPHPDCGGAICIAHNGIIENAQALRRRLEESGHRFSSQTDSEILAHLVESCLAEGLRPLEHAVAAALRLVQGTFGLVVLFHGEPGKIVGARRGSPLVVGIAPGEHFLASDASAILEHTRDAIYLGEEELAVITPETCDLLDLEEAPLARNVERITWELEQFEMGGHAHYMEKEIHEQPHSLRNALRGRIQAPRGEVHLGGLNLTDAELIAIRRIILTGCGTSWHAALVGEYLIEKLARIPVEVDYSSELRYRDPILGPQDVVIGISQSGETADTLAALREARTRGARILAICNVVGSTIAREADGGIYIHAGPEIGVASTKAFTGQVAVLTLLGVLLGRMRGCLDRAAASDLLHALAHVPDLVGETLTEAEPLLEVAAGMADVANALYLGRGLSFPVALEGALKLKEISYIHAEGYPAAEMKHGPIALIDERMPVVVLATRGPGVDKILSNMAEVRARRGRILAVVTRGDEALVREAHRILSIPPCEPLLVPLLSVVPLQLLAYHVAVLRGCDVDRPRNLAKSVTVE